MACAPGTDCGCDDCFVKGMGSSAWPGFMLPASAMMGKPNGAKPSKGGSCGSDCGCDGCIGRVVGASGWPGFDTSPLGRGLRALGRSTWPVFGRNQVRRFTHEPTHGRPQAEMKGASVRRQARSIAGAVSASDVAGNWADAFAFEPLIKLGGAPGPFYAEGDPATECEDCSCYGVSDIPSDSALAEFCARWAGTIGIESATPMGDECQVKATCSYWCTSKIHDCLVQRWTFMWPCCADDDGDDGDNGDDGDDGDDRVWPYLVAGVAVIFPSPDDPIVYAVLGVAFTLWVIDLAADSRGDCSPCPEPPPPEIDVTHTHWPCTGNHWHYYVYDQDPVTCICYGPRRLFGGCCGEGAPGAPC